MTREWVIDVCATCGRLWWQPPFCGHHRYTDLLSVRVREVPDDEPRRGDPVSGLHYAEERVLAAGGWLGPGIVREVPDDERTSTCPPACFHGVDDRCRRTYKFCQEPCVCACHRTTSDA